MTTSNNARPFLLRLIERLEHGDINSECADPDWRAIYEQARILAAEPSESLPLVHSVLRQLVQAKLDLNEPPQVEAKLIEDLGCDSLEVIDLIMAAEELFDVDIDETREAKHVRTIGDLAEVCLSKVRMPDGPFCVEYVDAWNCHHELTAAAAGEELRQFENAWPGGLEEIDAAFNQLHSSLDNARKLTIKLWNDFPDARTAIEAGTGPWMVWGVDREAEVSNG